jgi:hypothetical protein
MFAVRLETMASTVLFRLNLFTNTYFSQNFIHLGGCQINNKLIKYSGTILKLYEMIIIVKFFFKKIFNSFFSRLYFSKYNLKKNKKFSRKSFMCATQIFINIPLYFEANYKILHAMICRLPKIKEIVGPFNFPLSFSPHNWSSSAKLEY